jgi:hypothetical protein
MLKGTRDIAPIGLQQAGELLHEQPTNMSPAPSHHFSSFFTCGGVFSARTHRHLGDCLMPAVESPASIGLHGRIGARPQNSVRAVCMLWQQLMRASIGFQ